MERGQDIFSRKIDFRRSWLSYRKNRVRKERICVECLEKTFEGVNTKFIISGLLSGDFHFLLYNSIHNLRFLFNKLIFLSQSEKRFFKKMASFNSN